MRKLFAIGAAAVVFAVVPGVASAAPAPGIEITGAEYGLDSGGTDFINVSGTGVCAASGIVVIQVRYTDVDTGATGSGATDTQCLAAGEHIRWTVTTANGFNGLNDPRPGDRLNVTATSFNAISDSDQRQVTLKQVH